MVWNIKGFNTARKKQEVMRIVKEKVVEILDALETKIQWEIQLPSREYFNGEWNNLSNILTMEPEVGGLNMDHLESEAVEGEADLDQESTYPNKIY